MNFNSDDLLELEGFLKLNHISKEDICLVGSTTLSLIGIREHDDIDFVLHSKYQSLKLTSHPIIERTNNPWSTLFSDDKLIKDSNLHIIYNGFKFVIPELVFHKKIWHNRLKDRSDVVELREYAKMHKNWNWELLKDTLPDHSLFRILARRCKHRCIFYINKIRDRFRSENKLHEHGFQMVPTSYLLAKQVIHHTFNRYDIVVRYMAISSFLISDKIGISLYKKMQERRGGSSYDNPWKFFKHLILDIQENGFDISRPILVDKDMHIVDGAHRLACALYFNESVVPVKVNKKLSASLYGINWFKSNNFSSGELSIIEDNKQSLFVKNYLFFEVILWPPVSKYFDEIEKLISERFLIISSKEYNDLADFNIYIRELYKIDDIKDWKVNLKIERMSSYNKDIRVINIEIPQPDFRYKENNQLISKVVEALKKQIRTRYKSKVDDYLHDIIIHIGDNYSHTKKSKKLLNKW